MSRPRTALVTGASSGIGAALAEALGRHGANVVLAARRRDALESVAARVAAAGGTPRIEVLDVSDPQATVERIQQIDARDGGLDLVVANAGIGITREAQRLRWEDCAPLIDVNVRGAVATLLAALPAMLERGRGHLVGVSSLAGYRGLPRHAAYSATKAFLSVFLEGLRIDLAGSGIAVTDVRPGFVRTPLTAKNTFHMPFLLEPEEAAEHILRGVERRAPVVAFPWQLASAVRASRLLPAGVWNRIARMGPS